MKTDFNSWVELKEKRYLDKWDITDLSKQFITYFENGKRIKVQFPGTTIKTGTVGVTTGWKPSFLLMLASNHHGSSWLLSDDCIILAVKEGKTYKRI